MRFLCRLMWLVFFAVPFHGAQADSIPVCVRSKETQSVLTVENNSKSKKKKKKSPASVQSSGAVFPQYSPLKWTGKRERGWYEVQTLNNSTYWVRRRDLSDRISCLMVAVNKSVLRDGPGSKYKKLFIAEKGMVFQDLGGEDGWTQVRNREGQTGWINLDHTWKPVGFVRMKFPAEK